MRKFLLASLVITGCSSASFSVANDGGVDSATDSTDAINPNCPQADSTTAQYCISVQFGAHPGYPHTTDDANPVTITGTNGTIEFALFTADGSSLTAPSLIALSTMTPAVPATTRSPWSVDTGLTFFGSAPAGTYWVIAIYHEANTTGELRMGDFINPPLFDPNFNEAFATVTLTNGEVTTTVNEPAFGADGGINSTTSSNVLEIDPIRRNTLTLNPFDKSFLHPNFDGDGPILLAQISTSEHVASAWLTGCLDVSAIAGVTGNPVQVPTLTLAPPGIYAQAFLLFDYEMPTTQGQTPPGTLYNSSIADASSGVLDVVTIPSSKDPSSWETTSSISDYGWTTVSASTPDQNNCLTTGTADAGPISSEIGTVPLNETGTVATTPG